MAYAARVIQILIASPGDVQEEREIISEVIYEWNYVNSRDRSIVLLPIRWETHASPEMGSAPQAVINRQIVDYCDMAVAVFWTRLGTPTDKAESGTAEEIARIGNAGKPVMLYFSQAKVALRTVDLIEYQRLAEFQKHTYPKGLIENYSSLAEFRDKLRRQLSIAISNIVATDSQERSESAVEDHGITLTFAQGHPATLLSPPNVLELLKVICNDKDSIPDYADYETQPASISGNSTVAAFVVSPNRQFYREVVAHTERVALRRQLRLAMSSTSDRSMRDIHLDIKVQAHTGQVIINPIALSFPSSRLEYTSFTYPIQLYQQQPMEIPGQLTVQNISEGEWRIEADIPVIQAQRIVYLNGFFTLAATEDSRVTFDATVYSSDTLPFALSAQLEVRVKPQEMSYREILREMVPGYDEGSRLGTLRGHRLLVSVVQHTLP